MKSGLKRTTKMFLAVALHNLPEGIIVYVSSFKNIKIGLKLCLSIMLHNIPEGIEISDPLDLRVGEYTTFVAKLIGRTERDVTSLTTVDDFDYVSIENNKITAIRNSMLCNVADELTFKYNNGFHEYTVTDSVNILSSK